ncbi:uncharacterized protein LOC129611169 [Condylostylus longicornis]|uniref:uncharacterized protein LOC129611169 n=1 Tax=Condylostylus longicornis TaxID=2530218 RepID=UPI00244DB364|nr:uncharacterized protein LOC129611169 [Condylostylus longicornis]
MTKVKKDIPEKKSKKKKNTLKDKTFSTKKNGKTFAEVKSQKTEEEDKTETKADTAINTKLTEDEQKERNARTIFIGNLPFNTKKQQLAKFLKPYGEMKNCRFRRPNGKKILNKMKSENFSTIIAYAVMKSIEDAENCLILNGTEFKNHHIRVTKLEKKFSLDEDVNKRTIFVGNLRYSATEEKLHNIFSTCGDIEYVRTINNEKGCKGCAYICFKKRDSVGLAMELDKTLLDDRPIHVEKYSEKKKLIKPKRSSEKVLTGFERRMMKKMSKELGCKTHQPSRSFSKNNLATENPKNLKKLTKKTTAQLNYRGKKANNKKHNKKCKRRNHLMDLAKKIAPKDK